MIGGVWISVVGKFSELQVVYCTVYTRVQYIYLYGLMPRPSMYTARGKASYPIPLNLHSPPRSILVLIIEGLYSLNIAPLRLGTQVDSAIRIMTFICHFSARRHHN